MTASAPRTNPISRLNSPARTYRCRRFACALTGADARLAATVGRYSFGAGLSHSHLTAGLSRRRMTRGRRGSLALQRRALTSPPSCRIIPALPRSPAKAVRLGLNAGPWGEVVGDWPVVAGHGGRGGVDLLDEQGQGAGDAGGAGLFEVDGDRGGGPGDGAGQAADDALAGDGAVFVIVAQVGVELVR